MDEELGLTATAARPVAGGWNLANADRFKLLEAQGVDPQSAWKMTGTWRGKDGRLRQRIAGASALQGYGQASPISEMIGGFTGAPRRFSVMDPEAQRMQTARDIGEQASVAGQMFGAMTPFAASAAAAKAGQMMGVSPLTVYHGTPHRFSKFDSSKIGTGEGAQMYGRGLYFAEAPEVAESYARNLANRDLANQGRLNAHANAQRLANLAGDPKYAADDIRFVLSNEPNHPQKRLLQDTLMFLESGDFAKPLQIKGSLYTVDLPDEKIAQMLDWDKPLSQQSDVVKRAILGREIVDPKLLYKKADEYLKKGDATSADFVKRQAFALENDLKRTGEGWYQTLASQQMPSTGDVKSNMQKGSAAAAQALRDAGIPGIRYLDEGSRAAGKGTSNFVVFPGEEEALTILRQE